MGNRDKVTGDDVGEIANSELRSKDLPLPDADWGAIGTFALAFNGYAHWGSFEACAEQAELHLKAWKERQALPSSLADLRTCLFFEQRRWRHFGYDPDEATMRYLHALVEAIRKKILPDSGQATREGRNS